MVNVRDVKEAAARDGRNLLRSGKVTAKTTSKSAGSRRK
jgi:hypothetical protein